MKLQSKFFEDKMPGLNKISYLDIITKSWGNVVVVIFLAMLPLLHGCTSDKSYQPHPELTGHSESGKASYYAMKFQFRKTASGERFNNYAMTAAHKTLAFGTKVLVTSINTGKSVTVTINDRGPFVQGRIIDLTRAAFSEIEDIDRGIAEVKIEVLN